MPRTKTIMRNQNLLERMDAYWRAANYLSVGQIYLLANPLLREPLVAEHIKPRLLGHWGTTPGLNFLYAHLNRVIRHRRGQGGVGSRRRRTRGHRACLGVRFELTFARAVGGGPCVASGCGC